MSNFRTGKFERGNAPRSLRNLVPLRAIENIYEVDLAALAAEGFRLVLLDVDNTLLPWREETMPAASIEWVQKGKDLGIEFCLISNTRNVPRLGNLAAQLGIKHLAGKFKPSREMFLQAMSDFGATPDQVVMIGDQLFTDILGANRSGVAAFLVRPMAKKEFFGTKVNRALERAIRPSLYKALIDEDDDLPIVPKTGLFSSRLVRQIAKFCIVGGSSFVIDAGLHKIMMFGITIGGVRISRSFGVWIQTLLHGAPPTEWQAHNASFVVFKFLTSGLAILNSFYWNRKWTFGIHGAEERGRQLVKFLVVSLVGMGLNILISSGLNRIGTRSQEGNWLFATLIATVIVAVWNFCGQRFFAFRRDS